MERPKSTNNNANNNNNPGGPKRKVFRGASLLGLSKDADNANDEDPLARAIRLSQEEASKRNSTTFQQQNFQPSSNPLTRRSSFVAGKDPVNSAPEPPKLKYKDSDVKQLMKMGFNKDQAVQALMENNNNVALAAEALSGR